MNDHVNTLAGLKRLEMGHECRFKAHQLKLTMIPTTGINKIQRSEREKVCVRQGYYSFGNENSSKSSKILPFKLLEKIN